MGDYAKNLTKRLASANIAKNRKEKNIIKPKGSELLYNKKENTRKKEDAKQSS